MVTCKDCYYFNKGFCSNIDSVVSEKEIVCCGYVDKPLIIEEGEEE